MRVWCDQKPHQLDKGRLIFFYYINYLTKYYELLDTALLVLRGKPVAVFHMYHHAWCGGWGDARAARRARARRRLLRAGRAPLAACRAAACSLPAPIP